VPFAELPPRGTEVDTFEWAIAAGERNELMILALPVPNVEYS
jgi:hypothetical protein